VVVDERALVLLAAGGAALDAPKLLTSTWMSAPGRARS
jgi:hypothetical protein